MENREEDYMAVVELVIAAFTEKEFTFGDSLRVLKHLTNTIAYNLGKNTSDNIEELQKDYTEAMTVMIEESAEHLKKAYLKRENGKTQH